MGFSFFLIDTAGKKPYNGRYYTDILTNEVLF